MDTEMTAQQPDCEPQHVIPALPRSIGCFKLRILSVELPRSVDSGLASVSLSCSWLNTEDIAVMATPATELRPVLQSDWSRGSALYLPYDSLAGEMSEASASSTIDGRSETITFTINFQASEGGDPQPIWKKAIEAWSLRRGTSPKSPSYIELTWESEVRLALAVEFVALPLYFLATSPTTVHNRTSDVLPYGILPLSTIYRTAVFAHRCSQNKQRMSEARNCENSPVGSAETEITFKPCRVSKSLVQFLSQSPQSSRWELLTTLDLSRNVIGDAAFPPVLAVAAISRGLMHMSLERNDLSLVSAAQLFPALSNHPAIESLCVSHNNFYEAAGEALLRLLRVNRRITVCQVEGNEFTPQIQRRISKQLAANATEFDRDPFNPMSTQYAYLSNPDDIPDAAWRHIRLVWSALSVIPKPENPASDVGDDHPHSSDGTEAVMYTSAKVTGMSPSMPTVPLAVTAPLFATVISSLEKQFRGHFQDDEICSIFMDTLSARSNTATTHSGAEAAAAVDLRCSALYQCSFTKAIFVPLRVVEVAPHRWPHAVKALQSLGAVHYHSGVRLRHYRVATQELVSSLAKHMGPELMCAESCAAWTQVLALIVRILISGTSQVL